DVRKPDERKRRSRSFEKCCRKRDCEYCYSPSWALYRRNDASRPVLASSNTVGLGLGFYRHRPRYGCRLTVRQAHVFADCGKNQSADWRGRDLSVSNGGAGGSSRRAEV